MKNITAWHRYLICQRLWRNKWHARARHRWQITKAGRQEVEERKEEGERTTLPSLPPPLLSCGRLLAWRKQRGGRVVVTAYCLSSVCCVSSLGTHSSTPGYLYPLNIHAGGGRLQSLSSSHILWRRYIKESECCEWVLVIILFFQDFPVQIWTFLGAVFRRGCCFIVVYN